jgi:hypothetical protein
MEDRAAIVPILEQIAFSPEEMALLLSVDDAAFNEIASLDQIHNSTFGILEVYNIKRNAVTDRFGAEMRGNLGTTQLTREQIEWLAPRSVELETTLASIIERLSRDVDAAKAGLKNVHAVLEKELKLKKKLEFV